MNIFGLDGPFVKYMSLVADAIMLSLVFMITCIPIITIGPSITAIYYVMTKRIYEKESYIFKEYFSSFKQNFVQSSLTWVCLSILQGILVFNLYLVFKGYVFSLDQLYAKIFACIYLLLLIEIFIVNLYVFPIISRFHLGFVKAIKMAFLLSNRHMPSTISVACLAVLISYITYANPFLLVASMGIYCAFSSYFFMKIFKKYNPNMDLYESEISYNAINELKNKNKDDK